MVRTSQHLRGPFWGLLSRSLCCGSLMKMNMIWRRSSFLDVTRSRSNRSSRIMALHLNRVSSTPYQKNKLILRRPMRLKSMTWLK